MKLFRKLRTWFRRKKHDAEMAEEMRLHLEMQAERNRAAGMNVDDARYAALRQFGNVASLQEHVREHRAGRIGLWLEQAGQDSRYAVRSLGKSPGFTVIAVLSLALGIGANTALFSLIDEVLLRSLPVRSPDELVLFRWLSNSPPFEGITGSTATDLGTSLITDTAFSLPIYEQLRAQALSISELFAFAEAPDLTVMTDKQAERGRGQLVTGNYFSALGVSAARGRMLAPQDDHATATPAAVISYRFWQQNFGGDEGVIGKTLRVNQLPVTIVGVIPRDFIGTLEAGEAPDVTLPLSCEPLLQGVWAFTSRPHVWWLHIMGRLRAGAEVEQARAQLEPVFLRALEEERKQTATKQSGQTVQPRDILRLEKARQGLTDARRTYRRPLAMLMGMAMLVLSLACFNVANLLLARSAARRREIVLRFSLGATRGRIVRQLMTESGLLALVGGAVGLLVAWWGRNGLVRLWPVGDSASLVFDQRILAFTLVVSLVTGLTFGLVPAWQMTRADLNSELKGGGAGCPRSILCGSLTVAQISLAMFLLIGAGLFVTTLRNLREIDAGFDRSNLVLFELNAKSTGRKDSEASALFERIRECLAALPGVQSVAFSNYGLLTGQEPVGGFSMDGSDLHSEQKRSASENSVSPNFRQTVGIPLLLGRDLDDRDNGNGPLVVLVNEAFAKACDTGESVIGRHLTLQESTAYRTRDRTVEVVGVVGDAHYADLRGKIRPAIFVPYAQAPLTLGRASFSLRMSGSPDGLEKMIRGIVHEIEPTLPVDDLRTQEGQIDRLFARERFFALLAGLFGAVALALTCVGLYGLLAQEVTSRTREIGIRMAIGAQADGVARLMMKRGLGLALPGCLIGIVGSLASTRLIGQFLYGIAPTDLSTFLGATIMLLAVAGLACWLPARRAARVDPVVALRSE
ncbi:MAG: ABC transporter permease [Opitutae bacterium]|nr:ABC transporter permease [Opitutae bacterium]